MPVREPRTIAERYRWRSWGRDSRRTDSGGDEGGVLGIATQSLQWSNQLVQFPARIRLMLDLMLRDSRVCQVLLVSMSSGMVLAPKVIALAVAQSPLWFVTSSVARVTMRVGEEAKRTIAPGKPSSRLPRRLCAKRAACRFRRFALQRWPTTETCPRPGRLEVPGFGCRVGNGKNLRNAYLRVGAVHRDAR